LNSFAFVATYAPAPKAQATPKARCETGEYAPAKGCAEGYSLLRRRRLRQSEEGAKVDESEAQETN
jgi:hypothetical protein